MIRYSADHRRVPPARRGRRGAGPAAGQRRLHLRRRDHRAAARGGPRRSRSSGSTRPTWPPASTRSTRRSSWRCGRSCRAAQRALDRLGCEVVRARRSSRPPCRRCTWSTGRPRSTRSCAPPGSKADDAVGRRARRARRHGAADDRPQLVLNHRNPLVRRVTALADAEPGRRSPSRRCTARRCCSATTRSARPTRPCSTVVPRPARPGGAGGAAVSRSTDELWRTARRGHADAVRRGADRRWSSRSIRHADAPATDELAFAARMLGHHGVRVRRRAGQVVRHVLLVPGRVRPRPGAATPAPSTTLLWQFKDMVIGADQVPGGAAGPHLRGARRHGAPLPRRRAQPARGLRAPVRRRPARRRRRRGRRAGTSGGTPRRATTSPTAPAATRPSKVRYLAARGRDEEAVALAEPVLAGRLTCTEQPQTILTALLLPYLRTGPAGRGRATRTAGRTGCIRGNLADLCDIARPHRVLRADRQRGPRAGDPRAAPRTGWTGRRRRPRR